MLWKKLFVVTAAKNDQPRSFMELLTLFLVRLCFIGPKMDFKVDFYSCYLPRLQLKKFR